MGNSLLCRAGLGIRTVQTQGKNLKALQAKFDDRGEVAGSWQLKISNQKCNKDQKETIWKYYILEAKVNCSIC